MTMSIRLTDPTTGQDYSFEPARDIAFFWPQLLERTADSLREEKWEPWIGEYLVHTGTTEQDLMETLEAYYRFCSFAVAPELKHPIDALKASGFLEKPLPAQLAVCARLAQICTMAFWHGIRSSTRMNDVPIEICAMATLADEIGNHITTKWGELASRDKNDSTNSN